LGKRYHCDAFTAGRKQGAVSLWSSAGDPEEPRRGKVA
jgi:hypothetical protein